MATVTPKSWDEIKTAFSAKLADMAFVVLGYQDPSEIPAAQLKADRVCIDLESQAFLAGSVNGRVRVERVVQLFFVAPLRTGDPSASRDELVARVDEAVTAMVDYLWWREVAGFSGFTINGVQYGFGADPATRDTTFNIAVLSCNVSSHVDFHGGC